MSQCITRIWSTSLAIKFTGRNTEYYMQILEVTQALISVSRSSHPWIIIAMTVSKPSTHDFVCFNCDHTQTCMRTKARRRVIRCEAENIYHFLPQWVSGMPSTTAVPHSQSPSSFQRVFGIPLRKKQVLRTRNLEINYLSKFYMETLLCILSA